MSWKKNKSVQVIFFQDLFNSTNHLSWIPLSTIIKHIKDKYYLRTTITHTSLILVFFRRSYYNHFVLFSINLVQHILHLQVDLKRLRFNSYIDSFQSISSKSKRFHLFSFSPFDSVGNRMKLMSLLTTYYIDDEKYLSM